MVTLKEAVNRILPPAEVNKTKQPRLKTPNLMQAILLPFYTVPTQEGMVKEKTPDW